MRRAFRHTNHAPSILAQAVYGSHSSTTVNLLPTVVSPPTPTQRIGMRTSDVDILMVPGWQGSGPGHWQSRWERNLTTARRVELRDWVGSDKDKWVGAIIDAVATSVRPVVIVAHSLGVIAAVHAAMKLPHGSIAGALTSTTRKPGRSRKAMPGLTRALASPRCRSAPCRSRRCCSPPPTTPTAGPSARGTSPPRGELS